MRWEPKLDGRHGNSHSTTGAGAHHEAKVCLLVPQFAEQEHFPKVTLAMRLAQWGYRVLSACLPAPRDFLVWSAQGLLAKQGLQTDIGSRIDLVKN